MQPADFSAFDQHMMAIALTLAERALGTTMPNPAVGAVIVRPESGEVIARAATRPGGRPHAETEALHQAGARARGATLYVTLEPCAHHGLTPPCADAIVAAGVGRAVIGVGDPDARTAGQGISRLRDAGIAVETGVLGQHARRITLGHILRVTMRRPMVQLKLAVAADGGVPQAKSGKPTWVTGYEARVRGQLMRAQCDAILIGRGTAAADDPSLTCRLPGLAHRSPIRVVLSQSFELPLDGELVRSVRDVPVWVIGADAADTAKVGALVAAGVRLFPVAKDAGGVSIVAALGLLAGEGVTRLLVEGGPKIWRAFAAARVVDEVVVFQAGHGGGDRMASLDILARYVPCPGLVLADMRRIGDDEMHVFRKS